MSDDIKQRIRDLRKRAYRIVAAAKDDESVPAERVAELEHGIKLIESGWDTLESHPDPKAVAPFDLEARVEEWEASFDEKEAELGVDADE